MKALEILVLCIGVPLFFFLTLVAGALGIRIAERIVFPVPEDEFFDDMCPGFFSNNFRKRVKRFIKIYSEEIAKQPATGICAEDIFHPPIFGADFPDRNQEGVDDKVRAGTTKKPESDEEGF